MFCYHIFQYREALLLMYPSRLLYLTSGDEYRECSDEQALAWNTENVVTNKHSLGVHLFLKYPIFVQDKIAPDEE